MDMPNRWLRKTSDFLRMFCFGTRQKVRMIKRCFWTIGIIFALTFLLKRQSNPNVKSKIENLSACRLVQLKVDDPQLKEHFKHFDPLKCDKEKNWVYTENASLLIHDSVLKKRGPIVCQYDDIQRVTDHEFKTKRVEDFKSGSPVLSDFFYVNCVAKDNSTYVNVHATVLPSQKVLDRTKSKKLPKDALNLNVYMFGFDTLSHMMFMRKLPNTYKYLTSNLNGIVLDGYNIVGDGTPQALIPIFTGKTELELPLTRKRFENASYVNVYPWVWKEFENAGYVTMYSEDTPDYGVFQYRLKGFNEQPTDHYLRTFYLAQQAQNRTHLPYCIGSEPHHKVHFDYSQDLWKNYPKSVRKFAFSFHATLSHDDLNAVEVTDDYVVKHLKFFETNGHLNDTILIFMSDHGSRYQKIRETQQGKLEERLPIFVFVLPPWFEREFPLAVKNMRYNAARLTTPFDIHPTLRSILNFEYPPQKGSLKSRSISLFNEVPVERTCVNAGVELHWCACLSWTAVSTDDAMVLYIAKKLVDVINAETERERKSCALISLDKVQIALVYELSDNFINFKQSQDVDGFVPDLTGKLDVQYTYFQLTVRTKPGNALYEGSFTWNLKTNDTVINLNDVSRINKYGMLPHCVVDKDAFLAKWCVCYDKI